MNTTPPEHVAEAIRLLDPTKAGLPATTFSPYAIGMVQLCYFSYNSDPIATIAPDVADPTKVFPPQNNTYWRCTWGPYLDEAGGNLIFVAGLFLGSPEQPPASPFLVAIVTRGTDPTGFWSDLQQLYEDMTPIPQGNVPWNANTQEYIATGTLDAFNNVSPLPLGGRTLPEYLASLPAQDGCEPIILVTGHSLGGCLSTVIPPWLAATLPPPKTAMLVAITFAAPTAGNQAFVGDLLAAAPFTTCFYNPLDCIPRAWWDLGGINGIYGGSYPTPLLIEALIETTNLALWDDAYAQVPCGNVPQLRSTIIGLPDPVFGFEFMQEVAAQHACANYMRLMGLVPPYASSPKATAMQRFDPLRIP